MGIHGTHHQTWHQSKYSKNLPSTSSINTTLCPSCPSTISHPSSHPPLPSAPSSTTLHPSQFSAQSSVTLTTAPKLNSKEEFVKSKEAASAAAAYGTSLVGSAIQSYGVGALINATGTLSYKGAAYLGSLIFFASSAPSFIAQIFT